MKKLEKISNRKRVIKTEFLRINESIQCNIYFMAVNFSVEAMFKF